MSLIKLSIRFLQRIPATTTLEKSNEKDSTTPLNRPSNLSNIPSHGNNINQNAIKLSSSASKSSSMQIDDSSAASAANVNNERNSITPNSLLNIEILSNSSIAELKHLIIKIHGEKYFSLLLIHCGKILNDFSSIEESNLHSGETITAIAAINNNNNETNNTGNNNNNNNENLNPLNPSFPSSVVPRPSRPAPESILQDLNRLITPALISPLVDMGFSESRTIKALIINMLNTEIAVQWLIDHSDDPDIDEPLPPSSLLRIAYAYHLIPNPELEQCLSSSICTFTLTQRHYVAQHYYMCHTCQLIGGRGCCGSCARICHAGHQVEGPRPSESFFCDCGAGDGPTPCRALTQQTNNASNNLNDSNDSTSNVVVETSTLSLTDKNNPSSPTSSIVNFPHRYRSSLTINPRQPYDFISRLNFYHSNDTTEIQWPTSKGSSPSSITALKQQVEQFVREWLNNNNNNSKFSPSSSSLSSNEKKISSLSELFQLLKFQLFINSLNQELTNSYLSLILLLSTILTMNDNSNLTLMNCLNEIIEWIAKNCATLTDNSLYESFGIVINVTSILTLTQSSSLTSPSPLSHSPSSSPSSSSSLSLTLSLISHCLLLLSNSHHRVIQISDSQFRFRVSHVCLNLSLNYHRNQKKQINNNSHSNEAIIRLLTICSSMLDAAFNENEISDNFIISLILLLIESEQSRKLLSLKLGLMRILEPNISLSPDDTMNYAKLLQSIIATR